MRKLKNFSKIHRGFTTIALLMLFSALLFIVLVWDQASLSSQRALLAQRQDYIEQHHLLQRQVQTAAQRQAICDAQPKNLAGNVLKAAIHSANQERQQHFIYCERLALFKKATTKNLNEMKFAEFIEPSLKNEFMGQILRNPQHLPKDNKAYLLWLEGEQNEWTLAQNFNGIVVAEGDLTLRGKGKITGAIITQGNFSKEDSVTISYKKAIVTGLVEAFSQWQYAERSWYDFIPEK